jgi:hypothetical protein
MTGREGGMSFNVITNPYKAPQAPITVTGTTPKRSRWRLLPAVFSGLLGGFILCMTTIGIITLASLVRESGWTHNTPLLVLVMEAGLSGVLMVTASLIFVRGQWWAAAIVMFAGMAMLFLLPPIVSR